MTQLETLAFIDSGRKVFLRMGGFTFVRTPRVEIILNPPRMERCYTASDELHRIADAFLKAAETNGGDIIAINLIKEFVMAKSKIIVVDTKEKKVHAICISADKAKEAATEAHHAVISTAEEFEGLPEDVRLAIADTNPDVATMPKAEKLNRAYDIAGKPIKAPKAPKPARAKGVKGLIVELFQVPGARHSVADIVELTKGTEVSVKTAISDLRSTTYCKPYGVVDLTRLADGKYALISAEEKATILADAVAAKEAKGAEAKAKKEAEATAAKEKAAAEKAAKAKKEKAAAEETDAAKAKKAK